MRQEHDTADQTGRCRSQADQHNAGHQGKRRSSSVQPAAQPRLDGADNLVEMTGRWQGRLGVGSPR